MTGFKEHNLVGQNDDHGNQRDDDCFHAFCFRGQRNLFLKEIDEEMEDHAREDGTIAYKIDPCDDKANGDSAHEEVDNIKRIYH